MRERQWCYVHDPDLEEERRLNNRKGGKRGGRGRPLGEISDVKNRLVQLSEDVLEGEVDRADAAVAGQLLNYVIRAVGMELKVKEQLELEARLEELESIVEGQNEHRRQAW
jgi:hypothetical protein